MQVSQRGDYTTATTVANGAYSIDRWAAQLTSVTATTQHTARKQKLVATSTASGIMGSGQEIEITDTFFDNKQITISAKVTSNSTNARISFLYLGASNAWVGSASHTGGGTEETLTLTVTLPSALTRVFPTVKICDTDGVSSVNISSGDYVEFGEVQLEVGSVATEFEHRSYGEELALCQRYFQGILGGPYTWITEVQRHNSTGFRSVLHLPVPLRVVPSISYSNLAYWYNNGSLDAGSQSISVGYTPSGQTNISHLNLEYVPNVVSITSNGNLTAMLSFSSSGGYLDFSSEL